MKTIFILRDPWGQVASMLRGAALGKFEEPDPGPGIAHDRAGAALWPDAERFAALPKVEQFAWNWAILNEKAIDDLAGIDGVKVLRYHALCDAPMSRGPRAVRLRRAGLGQPDRGLPAPQHHLQRPGPVLPGFQEHADCDEPLAQGAGTGRPAPYPGGGAGDLTGAALPGTGDLEHFHPDRSSLRAGRDGCWRRLPVWLKVL